MASACSLNDASPLPLGWLTPRISFSQDEKLEISRTAPKMRNQDKDFIDFEFRRIDDPVAMLPADELFSEGKLLPLHLAAARSTAPTPPSDPVKPSSLRTEIAGSEPYSLSPRAPKCSSRWRELLGLKKQQRSKPEVEKASDPRSIKQLLYRGSRSSPIDSDPESSSPLLTSSRLSLSSSSSSSGADHHEELPRSSLDSDRPGPVHTPRARLARTATPEDHAAARAGLGSSVESPRMNAWGRIVFQGLERSSSSPESFNGPTRPRPRGMERSYSANVRVNPVLNVPVCSLRGSARSGSIFGFGHLFTAAQRRNGSPAAPKSAAANNNSKFKIERGSRDLVNV